MLKNLAALLLLATLLGCNAPRPRPAGGSAAAPPLAVHGRLPAAGRYRLDTERSELRVLVYKAGPLSNLGHNHVLLNRSLVGRLDVGASPATAAFAMSVPVAGFIVDDAQARQEEGADFPGDISADAKAGTLHNMLSAAVLDATAYPEITVHGTCALIATGAAVVTVDFVVAGHHSSRLVPLGWEPISHGFSATGSIGITQTDLGLKPYSLFMGALQVRDALQIKFKLVVVSD